MILIVRIIKFVEMMDSVLNVLIIQDAIHHQHYRSARTLNVRNVVQMIAPQINIAIPMELVSNVWTEAIVLVLQLNHPALMDYAAHVIMIALIISCV